MFRNSAWFLCTVLLCFGQILSQENLGVKAPSSEPVEPKGNPVGPYPAVDHHESEKVKPVETPTEVTSHSDANISKISPSHQDKPATDLPINKPTPPTTESTSSKPTTTSTHKPDPSTSSTPKLTTSTSTPSTSTPIPITPTPGPQKGSWNVTNLNITCLRIDGIFSVDYTVVFNKTKETVHYDVPQEASSLGKCGANIDEITLFWKENNFPASNNLTFIFEKNGTEYVLKSFKGSVYLPKLHKQQNFNTNNNETHFSTPVGQSYSCSSMRQVTVDPHANVILDQFHFQAFKNSSGAGFDTSKDCQEAPHTADIVPIVVGCVLALLVIAVLVAYLISRRRSQTRGYLSM